MWQFFSKFLCFFEWPKKSLLKKQSSSIKAILAHTESTSWSNSQGSLWGFVTNGFGYFPFRITKKMQNFFLILEFHFMPSSEFSSDLETIGQLKFNAELLFLHWAIPASILLLFNTPPSLTFWLVLEPFEELHNCSPSILRAWIHSLQILDLVSPPPLFPSQNGNRKGSTTSPHRKKRQSIPCSL